MNGMRLKLARSKCGFSLRDLESRIDNLVSAQAIGKYERGEMSPGSAVLIALSRALGVSIPYLLASQEVELSGVEFRTKCNTSAKDRARVETEVIEWVERYVQIEEILALDSAGWSCPKGMPRRIKGPGDAEKLADDLRAEWQLGTGPIPSMTEVLEERGVKVLLTELPEKVSGLTCLVKRPNNRSAIPVIVANCRQTLERRRFNLAHELGHQVISPGGAEDIEKLCHRFAGALLVNGEHLRREIGGRRSSVGVREILDLKRLYRVSAAAFLMRLEQVGALEHSQVEYAFRTYANRWRTEEPSPLENDDSERPKRFERMVYRAAAEDMISISKAVELLRLPLSEVENGLRGPVVAHASHR
ncbi:MAG: XRE family transcriptional regulator [Candidatus Hydrogenedentales bacterium]|jgi:Zn-dependent peptidase ImmA (M78 family)